MKMVRLTSTGKVTDAAISPDGKYVVHVVNDGEQQSLWMKQVSSPTSEVQINAPADFSYLGLTFSPSGDDLYFNAWDRKNPYALYRMSVLGGAAERSWLAMLTASSRFHLTASSLLFCAAIHHKGNSQ